MIMKDNNIDNFLNILIHVLIFYYHVSLRFRIEINNILIGI